MIELLTMMNFLMLMTSLAVSCIYHIIMSADLRASLLSVCILDWGSNLSDHIAIDVLSV